MTKYYDWDATWSRQTGFNGEFCIVAGAKDIGKTFGLRLKCAIEDIKKGYTTVEICRTKEEANEIGSGYFDKIQQSGYLLDYQFMSERRTVYYCPASIEKPNKKDWKPIVYIVALTMFQKEKKRTYANVRRMIFDEAIIDVNDKYHHYLHNEFYILASLIDTLTREQPNDNPFFRIYLLGNAVDLTCPYLKNLGVDKIPDFGYSWHNNKSTLLHYVEPWDADERRAKTLVGRMLRGHDEAAKIIFDNEFQVGHTGDISKKPQDAKIKFAIVYGGMRFGLWASHDQGLWYVTSKVPKDTKNIYTVAKKDGRVNYTTVRKSDPLMKLTLNLYYNGCMRYESPAIKQSYMEMLTFLGVK